MPHPEKPVDGDNKKTKEQNVDKPKKPVKKPKE